MRVAVIGAGLGGLTVALALRERGVEAEVYERVGEMREVGAAVALAANGNRLLERLGLGKALAEVSFVPTELLYRDGIDGEVRVRHRVGDAYRERFGAPFYGLHRGELQRVLHEAWGDEHLHLGWEATDLTPADDGLTVTFAHGAEETFDLVLGADGAHSLVREHVTGGTEIVYSGTSGFRGLVSVDDLPTLPDPQAIQFWTGAAGHLLHYAIGDGGVVNFLAVVVGPDRWPVPASTIDGAPGELLDAFDGWHPAVREMLDAVPQSERWGLFNQAPLASWHRGRAVLLGDAAHSMVPHHGQGANQSMEDAVVLAHALADAGTDPGPQALEDALRGYERRRRGRTRTVALHSWDTSPVLHLADGPLARMRDRELRRVPERYAWIHAYDADAAAGHPAAVS